MRLINQFLILTLLPLAACGGGGGGNGGTTSAVSSTSPAASATGVASNSVITATFSGDIFAATVDTSSFTVANSTNVGGAVSFDSNTNIATFTPSNNLPLLTSHTATLSTAITDLAGDALLTSNYNWSFTTADGTWKNAVLIETDNAGIASRPQIAFDSNGNALAVWVQSDGSYNNIYSNRYVAGTGWGTAALIETDAGNAAYPQIAIDNNGNALAVWEQYNGAYKRIYSNRYVAGTGWGAAAMIDAGASDATVPQIAIDNNGNALAVWEQYNGASKSIYSNRYEAGSWAAAALIESDAGAASAPQIAIDNNGNALAVWKQSNNIYSNRYEAGSWAAAALVETEANESFSPQIAFDNNGNALAVWEQSDGTHYNIYSNRYVAGTGWGAATSIETGVGDAAVPQIAFDNNGNALAVWQQNDGTRNNIWSNRYVVGTGWGAAVLIETDNSGAAAYPQIAIDNAGNALAVWEQSDGTIYNIYSNRYVVGIGWGAATLIETDNAAGTAAAAYPQIAIDNNGNALAVWRQQDSSSLYSIWANRFE